MLFKQEISEEIRQEFADLTFTSTFSVLTIGVALVAVAGLIFSAEPGIITGALLAGGIIVTCARVMLGLAYRWRHPAFPRTAAWLGWYAAGGYAFSAMVASLAVWSSLRGHTDYEILATTILFAYSTGMIVRVAVSPRIALVQLLVAFVPAAVGNLLVGSAMHYLLAALQLAFAISGSEMIKYLFETWLDRARSQRELARMSEHDDLTGLPNRCRFRRCLEESWKEGQACFSVYMLDLDGFKAINDELGHAAGDEVLQQVAARMRTALGAGDTPARLGGDEFAILHKGQEAYGLRQDRASHIIRLIASEPYSVSGKPVSIGVSVGHASSDPECQCADDVVNNADQALYAAKAEGKNRAKGSDTRNIRTRETAEIAA